MRQKTSHLLIGMFVLSGALLAVFGVMAVATGGGLARALHVEVYFTESVQGLEVGSPLRYRGVRIGEVREISFVNQFYTTELSYSLVRVAVALRTFNTDDAAVAQRKLQQMVDQGLRVRLASQGITGALYLESDLVDPQRFEVLPIDFEPRLLRIPSTPSVIQQFSMSLDSLLARLARTDFEGLITEARSTLTSAKDAIARADQRLGPALASLQTSADEATRTLSLAREEIARLHLDERLGEVTSVAGQAKQTLAEVHRLAQTSQRVLAGLDRSVGSENRDLEAVVGNLRQLTEHLLRLAETLERHPSLLFFGEAPKPLMRGK